MAVEALLTGLIDYAGLFPPAALGMPEAVEAYATYRRGADAWALGRFVLPAARLEEFAAAASPHLGEGARWRLSVLAGAADAPRIAAFNLAHAGRAVIDSIEGKATTAEEVAALAVLKAPGRQLFVEVPLGASPDALLRALAAHGMSAKMRTGGVTAEAFPTAEAVALFLEGCVRAGVASKATAGLHHPLRGEYRLTYADDSASGTMFGFLNVMCAALLIGQGLPTADAIGLLEERDARAFRFGDDGIRWRDWRVPLADIANARLHATNSFGSCSFAEPIHDLKTLALL
jgi:hypothetical protein